MEPATLPAADRRCMVLPAPPAAGRENVHLPGAISSVPVTSKTPQRGRSGLERAPCWHQGLGNPPPLVMHEICIEPPRSLHLLALAAIRAVR